MPLNITINGQADLGVTTGIPATITVQMGVPGAAATVAVGTTTTGNAGTDAEVVNVGTLSNAILDFTIPRGDKGETGNTGAGVAIGGTAGQVLAKIDGTNYNTHWIDGGSDFTGYQYEIHISQVDGSDTTGDGSLLNPYASITKGLTAVTSQRKTLIIHPGTYTESPSITVQYTVLTTFGLVGGNTVISGTISTNKGCTISGLKMTNLTITAPTGTGNVNILNCDISGGTLTKSGTADYTLIRFCDIGTTSITSSAGLVAIFGGNPNFITINNAGARVIVKNAVTVAPVLLAGNANFVDSILIATGATSNALTTSAGTIVTLANSQVIVPSFNNVARVSLSGFYSIFNTVFDKPNSTLVATSATGGSTNSIDYFQQINADGLTLSGTLFLPGLRNLLNTDLTVTAYNDTGAGTNFIHTFDAFDGTFALATNGGGLKFPDATVQTTAGLPLTGGTLTGSLVLSDDVFASGVSKTISANAIDGDSYTGFEIGSDNASVAQGSALKIKFGNTGEGYENQAILQQNGLTFKEAIGNTIFARYDTNGITFPDSTTQSTAGLPLTGGTMVNNSTILVSTTPDIDDQGTKSTFNSNGLSAIYYTGSEDTTKTNYGHSSIDHTVFDNPQNFHLNQNGVYGIGDGEVSWGVGINGLTFPDSSIQTTAGLPLTGGTLSAGLLVNAEDYSYDLGDVGFIIGTPTAGFDFNFNGDGLTLSGSGNGITFPDLTEQSTAFPPAGGTATQYIDGVGGLVEFPEVGDRYLTSSNNPLTIDNGNGKTLTVETGLAYSAQQNITVYHNAGNFMSGTVVSYNSATGVLVFDSDHHTGAGTFSSWTVNVGGAGGVLTFATTAEAEAMTSNTTVLSPARFRDAYFTANVSKPSSQSWLTATIGTGGINDNGNGNYRRLQGPTSAANTIVRASHLTNFTRGGDYNKNIDWTKYNAFYFRLRRSGVDTNSTFIITLGETDAGAGAADPSVRCVGIKFNAGGVVKILAHNGTTLVQPSTSYTPANSSGIDFLIVSDGSGTVEVFADGVSIGTTTGGPTTLLAGTAQQQNINARVFNNSTPSGGQLLIYIGGVTAYTS